MSEYNYARGLGTTIREPRVLFTAARVNGRAVGEHDLPMGDLSVERDAVDYMIGAILGRVWWMQENPGADVEVDITIIETGEKKTIRRSPNGEWEEKVEG